MPDFLTPLQTPPKDGTKVYTPNPLDSKGYCSHIFKASDSRLNKLLAIGFLYTKAKDAKHAANIIGELLELDSLTILPGWISIEENGNPEFSDQYLVYNHGELGLDYYEEGRTHWCGYYDDELAYGELTDPTHYIPISGYIEKPK